MDDRVLGVVLWGGVCGWCWWFDLEVSWVLLVLRGWWVVFGLRMAFGWLGGGGIVLCLGVLCARAFSSRTLSVEADLCVHMMRGELCVFQDCLFAFQVCLRWGSCRFWKRITSSHNRGPPQTPSRAHNIRVASGHAMPLSHHDCDLTYP